MSFYCVDSGQNLVRIVAYECRTKSINKCSRTRLHGYRVTHCMISEVVGWAISMVCGIFIIRRFGHSSGVVIRVSLISFQSDSANYCATSGKTIHKKVT